MGRDGAIPGRAVARYHIRGLALVLLVLAPAVMADEDAAEMVLVPRALIEQMQARYQAAMDRAQICTAMWGGWRE